MTAGSNSLIGARVLIVEDEYYLADDLSRALRNAGAEVIGPIGSLEEAERAVEEQSFDCAVLDMNLRGDAAFPVADRLSAAGIPFVIATGYNSVSLPERLRDLPRVEKPFDTKEVVGAISHLMNGRR